MGMSHVRLFGLTIASEIALPGLLPADPAAPVDVTVRRADLAGTADLVVEEAGSFAVRGGREILVDAPADMPARNVRLYLLGSAMGMLLHQRGLMPLHANAVVVDGKAVAVAGTSGAGKSTLAGWFHRQGYKLIGDDVIVIRPDEDAAIAFPGVPRLRLWGEALEGLGFARDGLDRSYIEEDFDKWDVPVAAAALASEGQALGAIYILADGPEIAIRPLSGAAAVSALFDQTYRGGYVAQTGTATDHWRAVTAIARIVPVFTLERPRDLTRLAVLGETVLAHARGLAARTSA
ncbi:hypothetical protein [Sphingomonas astaxanthinifaciens]|uniref:HPr kinase n=1 Tax=Sphingomonas astaxanthinifaciens DSM 22298 TaxID=1123267 RepID=A0ABQ5Z2N9_9SPHN|nr:hypothetical protein [Sphingomonas astaxanthinifaciens]GLR47038.1 HPr kinase [Sphingomonas astaxanthinifaciens DSM 22298]